MLGYNRFFIYEVNFLDIMIRLYRYQAGIMIIHNT